MIKCKFFVKEMVKRVSCRKKRSVVKHLPKLLVMQNVVKHPPNSIATGLFQHFSRFLSMFGMTILFIFNV